MATAPQYAATVNVGSVLTNATADTSMTAPTNTATVFTAGASGSRIDQIRIAQVLTTGASGILNIFRHDGSIYHLLDFFSYSATTVSSTATGNLVDIYVTNLVLKSGDTLRVTNTVASGTGATAATHKVTAFGGDF